MDKMQAHLPALQNSITGDEIQRRYIRDKVNEIESCIREALDDLVTAKIDFIEDR